MNGKPNHALAVGLTIVVVLIIGTAATWYYLYYFAQMSQIRTIPNNVATTSVSTASSTLLSTAGWKKYVNAQPGFSIEYPPTWTYELQTFPENQGILDFKGAEGSLRVDWNFDRGGGTCPGSVVEMPTKAGIFTSCQQVQTDGSKLFGPDSQFGTILKNEGVQFAFSGRMNSPYQDQDPLFLTILSTFQFTPTHLRVSFVADDNDDYGKVHITMSNGEVITPENNLRDQVGASSPVVAGDRRTVGWLALYSGNLAGQSYPWPGTLVIFRDGKIIQSFNPSQIGLIHSWRFIDEGGKVAMASGPAHGTDVNEYDLYDVASGKLLSSLIGYSYEDLPQWAKDL